MTVVNCLNGLFYFQSFYLCPIDPTGSSVLDIPFYCRFFRLRWIFALRRHIPSVGKGHSVCPPWMLPFDVCMVCHWRANRSLTSLRRAIRVGFHLVKKATTVCIDKLIPMNEKRPRLCLISRQHKAVVVVNTGVRCGQRCMRFQHVSSWLIASVPGFECPWG